MGGKLITPVQVNVTSFYFQEFWWSHYGFRTRYEDILQIQSEDRKVDYGVRIFMKGLVREILKKGDIIAENKGRVLMDLFGKNLERLLQEESILFSSGYKPGPLELREVSPWFSQGKKRTLPVPPHFSIYHSAEYETYEVVDLAVRRLVREYAGIRFSKIVMINEKPSEGEVRRAYEEQERKAAKYRGKKREIIMEPDSLALVVGCDQVDRFPEIKYGVFGDDGHLYAELKDGSRHPIGKPRLHVLKKGDG